MTSSDNHGEQTVAIHLDDLRCPACAGAVEAALRQAPGVQVVHLDWPTDTAHVRFDPHRIDVAAIEWLVASTGCRCAQSDDMSATAHANTAEVAPSSARRLQRLRHGVDVQPITMGTKFDRMQYEAPATAAHRPSAAPPSTPRSHDQASTVQTTPTDPPAPDHAVMGHAVSEMDHAAMGHTTPAPDHAAMGHDMAGMDHAGHGPRYVRSRHGRGDGARHAHQVLHRAAADDPDRALLAAGHESARRRACRPSAWI